MEDDDDEDEDEDRAPLLSPLEQGTKKGPRNTI